ncbi:unnamed protein product [Leptidea sinapis]|uniref:Uncharacterized protein n=1 Tax=Leptidea sinapis TaxID=189913 RepID=A0A5E4QDP7_9NEOP|nr:unnamed protein product [Leptidea sinapis]
MFVEVVLCGNILPENGQLEHAVVKTSSYCSPRCWCRLSSPKCSSDQAYITNYGPAIKYKFDNTIGRLHHCESLLKGFPLGIVSRGPIRRRYVGASPGVQWRGCKHSVSSHQETGQICSTTPRLVRIRLQLHVPLRCKI